MPRTSPPTTVWKRTEGSLQFCKVGIYVCDCFVDCSLLLGGLYDLIVALPVGMTDPHSQGQLRVNLVLQLPVAPQIFNPFLISLHCRRHYNNLLRTFVFDFGSAELSGGPHTRYHSTGARRQRAGASWREKVGRRAQQSGARRSINATITDGWRGGRWIEAQAGLGDRTRPATRDRSEQAGAAQRVYGSAKREQEGPCNKRSPPVSILLVKHKREEKEKMN